MNRDSEVFAGLGGVIRQAADGALFLRHADKVKIAADIARIRRYGGGDHHRLLRQPPTQNGFQASTFLFRSCDGFQLQRQGVTNQAADLIDGAGSARVCWVA